MDLKAFAWLAASPYGAKDGLLSGLPGACAIAFATRASGIPLDRPLEGYPLWGFASTMAASARKSSFYFILF